VSLLDQNIKNYIIKPRENLTSNFDIEDERGNKLGRIKRGIIKDKFSLFDSDESLLLTINKKIFTWKGQTYEVKNPNGNLIGKLKQKGGLGLSPDVLFENSNGDEILSGEIPLSYASCEIYDDQGNVIASVAKENEERFIEMIQTKFVPWILKIDDLLYDQITILGVFLAMYHADYHWNKASQLGISGNG
jgi:uncharacterized protein YxjI